MIHAIRLIVLIVPITAGISSLLAEENEKPKADPKSTPLELSITGKTTKYTLDLGGQSAEEFKKSVDAAAKAGRRPVAAPAVDLTVEIKNTSDKAVEVWITGDPVVLTLTLKGKGAVNVAPNLAWTEEFRSPRAVEIPAGKTHSIPVKMLVSGYRGGAHWSYWTEPGEYELAATFQTGVSPAPKGAKDGMDGYGMVTLTSAPLKITVEGKK